MSFQTLRSFVDFLESKNDLVRITASVDPHLEITEITSRVVQKKGPALLFENVKGSAYPILINSLGAERRMTWALGRTPDKVGIELQTFADKLMPPSLKNLWNSRGTIKRIFAMKQPKTTHPSVTSHKMEPAQLNQLPIAQSWPGDGGPFITFPLVMTKSPVDGKQNMGIYRMQKFSNNETGMHWQIGKGGGYHYLQAEEHDQDLPVAVVIGADPLLMFGGILPLPEGVDEVAFAGFLRGQGTKATVLKSSGIAVPAESEFILEGSVRKKERRMEGPYGDHFGHYSQKALFPVFHVDRIWHRPHPIFPISVVGKPPQEDQVMGDAVQEILLPLLKVMHPEVTDLWAYQEAGFHNLLVASVKQRYQKEAIKTALWTLGEGQLSLTKVVVLVDVDVNARRFPEVLKAIAQNFDPKSDFQLLPGTSQDTLDFTGPKMNLGSKMILDATRGGNPPRPLKGRSINLEKLNQMDSRIRDSRLVNESLLVVQVERDGRAVLEKMLQWPDLHSLPVVAVVSPDVPLFDPTLLIWGIFTRFDCAQDTFFGSVRLEKGHPVYEGPLCIDATWKQGYPQPLTMDESIVKKVDQRWKEYGIEKNIQFGYKELSHSH